MRMFGGVPINVFNPPSKEANASGISSREGARPVWRAISITTGRNKAATPMLFINPDRTPTVTMMITMRRVSPPPANRRSPRPRILATPVLDKPALRIKIAQTVTTAMLLKPESASAGEIRLLIARLTRTIRATTSTRTRSVMKRMMATTSIARTVAISAVNVPPLVIPNQSSVRTIS